MSRVLRTMAALALVFLAYGCEADDTTSPSESAATPDATQASDAMGAMDSAVDPGVTLDTTGGTATVDAGVGMEDTAVAVPDPEPEDWAYPAGPYGKNKFDIIEDMAFFDPWENRWVYLHEYHNDPSKKMLVLIAGAGWCGACRLEADHLVEYYDEYEQDGLGILYTLYEDNDGKELFIPGEDATADMAFMNSWKTQHAVDYPLVADVGFTLQEYFTDNSTPLTMVIRTEDMLIKYVDQGYSSTFLDYQILMNLYN